MARLRAVGANGSLSPENIDDIIAAHRRLLRAVLEQQLVDTEQGVPLSNAVDVRRLSAERRRELRDAFGILNLMSLILR